MTILRPATSADAAAIRTLIHQVGINPMSLDWRRFIVIVDGESRLLACGQVKPHQDGTCELASIAVQPGWRGRGLARQVIQRLLALNSPPLYLTCRSELQPFYRKFGFRALAPGEMPPYFRRISRLVAFFSALFRQPPRLAVMVWEK